MGLAFDAGMRGEWEPAWKPWFEGTRPVKDWLARLAPDHIVIVYNDHLNHFTFDAYPTFAIGVADSFPQADEGWGPRPHGAAPFPAIPGDTAFGWALAEHLIRAEGFDLTVCQELALDHGVYSWLPYVADPPWPAAVTPIAVNMIRHPIPTQQRQHDLGRAIRRAVEADSSDARVLVIATGGMSHQIAGTRFGMANQDLDRWFLAGLRDDMPRLMAVPQEDYMRLGGAEAAELGIWFAMRAALSDGISEIYRYQVFPKITGCGVICFEEPS
jgi:hypothetical protein